MPAAACKVADTKAIQDYDSYSVHINYVEIL
jgi:hypothetical protein